LSTASAPNEIAAANEFRVSRVLNRAASIVWRNFPRLFVIVAVAELPSLLLSDTTRSPIVDTNQLALAISGFVLAVVLNQLSQAILVYGAFQDMRGQPVSLIESIRAGLRRLLPVIGLAVLGSILAVAGLAVLVVPGLIVLTAWFVATPVCVVERLGPWRSLDRSARLTKGYRWKIFGLLVSLILIAGLGATLIEFLVSAVAPNSLLVSIGSLVWDATWTASSAIVGVVAYRDLRVAKEGIDTEQIAAVFD
jgi:hypothetical protein